MSKSKAVKGSGNSKRKAGQLLSRKDDAVQWFQREDFDPAEFIGLLKSEKEIDAARNELTQLNDYCKQEVQKVVHAHHKDFLEASRNIQEVEVLVDELRNYVSGSVAVVANLVDLPSLPKQFAFPTLFAVEGRNGAMRPSTTWESILALQAELIQGLQVAVAEHDVSLARALLSAAKDMVAVVDRDGVLLAGQADGDGLSSWRHSFESAIAGQKAILIEELQRQLSLTNSSTLERRHAAQNLGILVGPGQATQALLGCHSLRVRAAQQHLLKQHSAAGGDPDGVEYAGGLAQRTFLAIGAAAEDVRAVFPSPAAGGQGSQESERPTTRAVSPPGPDSGGQAADVLPQVSALIVQWASDEARHCASLLCRHALTPFVATGMAVGALLCVGLSLVFCVALESSHGLALRTAFMQELWPLLEVIVRRHLHRLREDASASASVDATNAALQAVCGNGMVRESAGELQAFVGANGSSTGRTQERLSDLFRPAGRSAGDAPAALVVPAGLTCLPMLVPEVKALAEGLSPLGSRLAVAVLRQGVQAIFESVCEKVHASLTRLVGSSTAAGCGNEGNSHGSLLAAYITKAEKDLRLFAEKDMQMALEPLSYVCGPVAPSEVLAPALVPLRELLTQLPEPAPEAAPAGPNPSQSPVLQPQSSGLLDRIRAQLEAEQGERRREHGDWRSRDVHWHADAAEGTLPAEPGSAVARELQPFNLPSTSNEKPVPSSREPTQPVTGRETIMEQADYRSGDQVVESRQRQRPDASRAVKRLEVGDIGELATAEQPAEAPPRRRPRPPAAFEPGLGPLSQTQQHCSADSSFGPVQGPKGAPNELSSGPVDARRYRKAALDPASAAAPFTSGVAADQGGVEAAAGPPATSRSRDRGRDASGAEPGEYFAERFAPGGQQPHRTPLEAETRLERTDETAPGDSRQMQQPSGRNRARREQLEAETNDMLPSNRRADARRTRSRQGQDQSVRFQQMPKSELAAGGPVALDSDGELPARRPGVLTAQQGAVALHQPDPQGMTTCSRWAASQREEGLEDAGGELSAMPRARRLREKGEQPRQMQQPEVQPRAGPQSDEADDIPPQRLGRVARRSVVIGNSGDKGESDTRGERMLPSPDEGLLQPRRARQPRLQRACDEDNEDVVGMASATGVDKEPRGDGRTPGQPATLRGMTSEGDGGVAATRGAVTGGMSASTSAVPVRPRRDRPDDHFDSAAGGVGRKANRFGVVLSDDEDGPMPAHRLRRRRAAATAAATAGAVTDDSTGPVSRAEAARGLALSEAESEAMQADARRSERLDRPNLREEIDLETGEKPMRSNRRQARALERAEAEVLVIGQQKERGLSGRDAVPAEALLSTESQPQAGGRPLSVSAVRDAQSEATGGGEPAGTNSAGAGKPQTARERLAARMAAKVAAVEGML